MPLQTLFIFMTILFWSCNSDELKRPSISNDNNNIVDPSIDFARWDPRDFPLDLKIGDAFDNEEIDFIEQMAQKWQKAYGDNLNFYTLPFAVTSNKDYDNLLDYDERPPGQSVEFGLYKSTKWFADLGQNVLAVTQYFGFAHAGGLLMSSVDIIFNYRDHQWSLNPNRNQFDLPSVALHELGHLLGLFHNTDSSTTAVMDPFFVPGLLKRDLFAFDIQSIQNNYQVNIQQLNFSIAHLAQSPLSPSSTDGERLRGVIELRVDGQCLHYVNKQLVYTHFHSLSNY